MIFYLLKYYLEVKLFSVLPENKRAALQLRKFRKIFEWARVHSEFYKRTYEAAGVLDLEIKSFDDIQKIPVVDKDMMLSSPEHTLLTKEKTVALAKNSSSGSTGMPMTVYSSKKEHFTTYIRTFKALKGYNPFKKFVLVGLYSQKEQNEKHTFIYYFQKYLGLFRREKYSVYTPPSQIIDKLCGRKINTISTTPTCVKLLLEELKISKRKLTVKQVLLSGETVFDDIREDIKTYMHAKVINIYGCTELLSMAWTNPDGKDFKYLINTVYVEYINPVEIDGEVYGEMVLTNLLNKTEPFVRYNIHDLVQIPVSDGKIGEIIGRIEDNIELTKGKKLHRLEFCSMFKPLVECRQYKIIKKKDEKIYFQAICKPNQERNDVEAKILNIWSQHISDCPLEIQFFEELPLSTETGKFKMLEQEK